MILVALLVIIGFIAAAVLYLGRGAHDPLAVPSTANQSGPLFLPDDPRILFIGDSFTEGYGADVGDQQGWAYLAAESLGWPYLVDGVGWTGFSSPGEPGTGADDAFRTRIERLATSGAFVPNLVVIQGGINDWATPDDEEVNAVADTVALVELLFADAQVVVVGPLAADGEPALWQASRVQLGAQRAGVPFLDPAGDRWVTSDDGPGMLSDDGIHITTAGHALFATRFLEAYRALFDPALSPGDG